MQDNQPTATVIARFGHKAEIETDQGERLKCFIKKHIQDLVVGDIVTWETDQQNNHRITSYLERRNILRRQGNHSKTLLLGSNIDHVIITLNAASNLSLLSIDQYIAAAELSNIKPVLCLNKIDLLTPEQLKTIIDQLKLYQDLGYPLILTSCEDMAGLEDLKKYLNTNINTSHNNYSENKVGTEDTEPGKLGTTKTPTKPNLETKSINLENTCVFVGMSGAGKSSLIQLLLPDEEIKVGEVSTGTQLGKHTTTTARMYHFPSGGRCIDSPGIREFSLWPMSAEELILGFVEFKPYLGDCRFRNCHHRTEPDCAITAAVTKKHLAQSRFDNYHTLAD